MPRGGDEANRLPARLRRNHLISGESCYSTTERLMTTRRRLSTYIVVFTLLLVACGSEGSTPPSGNATGEQGSTVPSPPASTTPPTTVRSAELATFSITSGRGYKYSITLDSVKAIAKPGDPGLVKMEYDGRLTLTNDISDRSTPEIGEIVVTLYYDADAGREFEVSNKLEKRGLFNGTCSGLARVTAGKRYCEATVFFNYPRPQVIPARQSTTVTALVQAGSWIAQETSVNRLIAFLEHPALVSIKFREGTSSVAADPVPTRT